MFGKSVKVSPAISSEAKGLYGSLKSYGGFDTIGNPVMRRLGRRIINSGWRQTLEEIDFPYSMSAITLGGVEGLQCKSPASDRAGPVILYIHAGAFVCGSPEDNASAALPQCELAGAEVYAVRYSLAPEFPFPRGLEDVRNFYCALRSHVGNGRRIVIMGDSAGANIALSSMVQWRNNGIALPDCAVLISGCLDGTASSDTMITMQRHDPLIRIRGGNSLKSIFGYYANGTPVSDWRISPIYADLSGLPPMMLQVGSRETLLGDSARLSEKARTSGVNATLRVLDGMFHMFHLHWSMPEAKSVHQDIANFIATARVQAA
ncbi:alpha/beta hydrolase [Parvularcula flava]|uniref:Alpha/beta hydrolase n=1 Tax=Aquisalinus luteolus TaxID=1566827 RepID=A0A8J3A0L9_9PROT|nr:alpha/beta hydrolase [Aquisalinus luteolus]NHK26795.1 alpha/beta hydrolase [Aquisalinus luteolus]GGH93436.1 hypothetical protein GCM10011355_05270 [Aquisalinus luteolus]